MRTAVTLVDLIFWTPISDPVIEVSDPDGFTVDGQTSQVGNTTARFEMPPSRTEGEYRVSYEVTSGDGDLVSGTIVFFYVADADSTLTGTTPLILGATTTLLIWAVIHATRRTSAAANVAPE